MHHKTIAELSHDLNAKKISSVELTKHFLERIKQFDEKLNSFITVTEDHALKAAQAADEQALKRSSRTADRHSYRA